MRYRDLGEPREKLLAYRDLGSSPAKQADLVAQLITHLDLPELSAVGGLTAEQVEAFLARPKRQRWKVRGTTEDRVDCERRKVVISVSRLWAWLGLPEPAWVAQVRRRPRRLPNEGRTTLKWWPNDHPWLEDLHAALAQAGRRTQKGRIRGTSLLQVASHLADSEARTAATEGREMRCIAAVLLDTQTLYRALTAAMEAAKDYNGALGRARTVSIGTVEKWVDSVRLLFDAVRVPTGPGAICPDCRDLLLTHFGTDGAPATAVDLEDGFNKWNRNALALVKGQTQKLRKVRAPRPDEQSAIVSGLYGRLALLIKRHKERGFDLGDFARWSRWSRDLRVTLGVLWALECKRTAGMRIGSVHGQQPRFMHRVGIQDARYAHAVEVRSVMVKKIDGHSDDHGNQPYGPDAPAQDCSDWIVLGAKTAPYHLDEILEWYLHSTGQCRGQRAGCAASEEPVLRMFEVRWDDTIRKFRYFEITEAGAVPRSVGVSGEWLAGIDAPRDRPVRYNPLWFDVHGKKPMLESNLRRMLQREWKEFVESDLTPHQWRHIAFVFLMREWGFTETEAARLCHMDPLTLKGIYDNRTPNEILEWHAQTSTGQVLPGILEQENERVRAENEQLHSTVAELKHRLEYAKVALGRDLPMPPKRPHAPAPSKRRARARRRPLDATALARSA